MRRLAPCLAGFLAMALPLAHAKAKPKPAPVWSAATSDGVGYLAPAGWIVAAPATQENTRADQRALVIAGGSEGIFMLARLGGHPEQRASVAGRRAQKSGAGWYCSEGEQALPEGGGKAFSAACAAELPGGQGEVLSLVYSGSKQAFARLGGVPALLKAARAVNGLRAPTPPTAAKWVAGHHKGVGYLAPEGWQLDAAASTKSSGDTKRALAFAGKGATLVLVAMRGGGAATWGQVASAAADKSADGWYCSSAPTGASFVAACAGDLPGGGGEIVVLRYTGDRATFEALGGAPALLAAARALTGLTPPPQPPKG